MASSLLVGPDIDGGERLLQALAQDQLTIVAAFWQYPRGAIPWRLYVVSPLVDVEGSLPVYRRIQAALQRTPTVAISLTDIIAAGERDPIVRHLRQATQGYAQSQLPVTVTLPNYAPDPSPLPSVEEPARLYVYRLVPQSDREELEKFEQVLAGLRNLATKNGGSLPPDVVLAELHGHDGWRFERYYRAFKENTTAPVRADTLEGIRRAAEDLLR